MSFHTHSSFSDGTASLAEMVETFHAAGIKQLGFTDHYADRRSGIFAARMDQRNLWSYLAAARALPIAVGLEVEVLEDGTVAIDDSERELVDYVLGGLHWIQGTRFFADPTPIDNPSNYVAALRTALIAAIESGRVDAIAHPTKLPDAIASRCSELMDAAWRAPLIAAAARCGVAFDLNEDSRVPDAAFVRECCQAGVKLLIGSDAHALDQAKALSFVASVWQEAGASVADLFIPGARA